VGKHLSVASINAEWRGGEFDGDWIALPAKADDPSEPELDYIVLLEEPILPRWDEDFDPTEPVAPKAYRVPIVKTYVPDPFTGKMVIKWILDWNKRE